MKWFVSFVIHCDNGRNRFFHTITTKHPLDWIKTLNETEGSKTASSLISWQELPEENPLLPDAKIV
jgi:hypothetical protein